ncbi:MAG: hypothetical protein J7J99_00945 [Thermoprotei archaeon]|nr:hypothetical protein [Thermoprotei archaeon]
MASSTVEKGKGEIIDIVEEVRRLISERVKDKETLELALKIFEKFYYNGSKAAREYIREIIERVERGESIEFEA